jgi:trehalose synthase
MLGLVPTPAKSLADYLPIVGEKCIEEIRQLGRALHGARVLHVNATAYGGGVAELLATLVPLMNDAGLQTDWRVIKGADEFFHVTKTMHNALQGGQSSVITDAMWETWHHYNSLNAAALDADYDFVVIHDPQPAALLRLLDERRERRSLGKWVWRCHIDLTDARPEVWAHLRPYVETYDAAIFTLATYVKQELNGPRLAIAPPAIDPLSAKNAEMSENDARAIVKGYGLDVTRPIITQVSRFDPWKDPLGVIDAYRIVKQKHPTLQLAMIASMACDDPEGMAWYELTARHAGEDPDIYLLSNLQGVGNIEVNAFQTLSQVVIQKSIREGFGLVVTEGLWKGKPVVAGNVGGIPLQVIDGETGYLVNSAEECAEGVLKLLDEPELAERLGQAGREHVRQNFLITRYLRDYLALFASLN